MKKLITLTLICLSVGVFAQRKTWDFNVSDLPTDTTITFKYGLRNIYSLEFVYDTLAGTSGTIDVQFGNTDSTLVSVGSGFPITVTTSSESDILTDYPYGSVYLAFKITKGTLTGGRIRVLFNYW